MATVANLLTDIAAINAAGRTALADKGVTTSADATVYGVIQRIADVYQAGTPTEFAALCTALGLTAADIDTLTTAVGTLNTLALQDLAAKGATGVNDNTTDILDAYANLPSGGAELNIAYGDTAPEDTSKLWVKTAQPQNVTVDYDLDNTVETVTAETAVLPSAVSGLGVVGVVGKKCYVFRTYSNTYIYEYDTETDTLTRRTSFSYGQIANGVVGTKIYTFGGELYGIKNQISVYDTETDTLTTLPVTLPTAANQIACGVVGTKCYLFGGVTANTHLDTINVYDTENGTIATLPVTLPTAARAIGVGVVGTKIYLFGGATANGFLDTINVFDTTTNTISTLTETLSATSGGIAVTTLGTKCYLIGGGNDSVVDTIQVFDTETKTLTTLTETLQQAATGIACGVVGTDAYLFGGWTGSENTKNINKFNVTFPLAEGDVYVQTDVFKNKFTLIKSPTEVKTGVSAVYVGNASNEAEYADALLYDGAAWQPIT